MRDPALTQQILEAARADGRVTAASVVHRHGVDPAHAKRALDRLASEGLLELDSDADGHLYYHAPGLAHVRAPLALAPPRRTLRRALAVFAVLSTLDVVVASIATLAALSREAKIFVWFVVAGLPGLLLGLAWLVAWGLDRRATRRAGR